MSQKRWELKQTKQATKFICANCQDNIVHHSHYQDERFCEECKIEITIDYNKKLKDPDEREHINRYINCEDFLESVYEEISPKYYGIDEREQA